MLTITEGLRLQDVRKAVGALRRIRYGKGSGRAAGPGWPIDMANWKGLPWDSMICGFALAEKSASRAATGVLSLRVYVRRKVAKSRIADGMGIPAHIEIKRGRDRFRLCTDVVELPSDPSAHREMASSSSIGSFTGVTEGTLGLAVLDRNGRPFALTCSHVASPWFRQPQGDAIESPPDRDGTAGVNTIGRVFSWTQLVPEALHGCDAALIEPAPGVTLSNLPLRLAPGNAMGNLTLSEFLASPSRRVQVFTRRKVISGVVQSVLNHFTMVFLGNRFHFQDVVEVNYAEPLMGGDSGGAVVDESSRRVLGLHFAGFEGTGTGFFVSAQSITRAFSAFGLRPM